jgi:hypothetical protein
VPLAITLHKGLRKRPRCLMCDLRVAYFCFPPFNCIPPGHSAIHSPSGLKFLPLEKANAIVDCRKNQFSSHELCDENHELRVEARVQAFSKAVNGSPPERIRPCGVRKLINSLREAYGIDGIPNECLRHLPRRSLIHLTHIFNHCIWLLRATGWTIGVLGFDSRRGLGIFLFTTASRMALGHTQPPIQWVPGVLSLGVKRPGCEADHSPTTIAEVKE